MSDYGIFEDLHSGANSENFRTASSQRNFAAVVHQAQKDFGFYLASAEDDYDLSDRVDNVLAELRTAGVEDPQSVLEALAASDKGDDTEDDSDSSEDDSDVPDFVDTDDNDSKDRDEDDSDSKKESSKTAAEPIPGLNANPQGLTPTTQNPVKPRNVGAPGVVPDDFAMLPNGQQGDVNNSQFAGTPNPAPINAPNPANPNPYSGTVPGTLPAGSRDPLAGIDPTLPAGTHSADPNFASNYDKQWDATRTSSTLPFKARK